MKGIIAHYDNLIDENNDPVNDPKHLQEYMNKWDGQVFIDELQMTLQKDVLEIGVGTGRIAVRVCNKCKSFNGIDISLKTIRRANENLSGYSNVNLINGDFLTYQFDQQFDIIYLTLTFMHINEKPRAIKKISELLKPEGRFVLSIDKNKDDIIDYYNYKIKVFPDNPEDICGYLNEAGLIVEKQLSTDYAIIFIAKR